MLGRLYRRLPVVREVGPLTGELRALRAAVLSASALQLHLEASRSPRYREPKRLLASAFQVCSQNGEDGIIQEIFRRIGTADRTFLEIGVGNGVENNTAFLLSLGWRGYWIDCDGYFSARARHAKKLRFAVAKVEPENARALLADLGVPQEFDLLSIDIDHNTYYLWQALGHLKPRVVVVEYNSCVPAHVDWKVNYDGAVGWSGTQNFGASLKALERLGRDLGYSLVGCDPMGCNAFFVRNDLTGDHFAMPFVAENHFEAARFPFIHRLGHPNALLDIQEDP